MAPPALTEDQTALLYSRVSTEDQAESGLGLDDQAEKLQALATLKGWASVDLVDDGESAKTLNRPAMQQALQMLADGDAHALVTVKLDRLTRSVADLAALMAMSEAQGWSLVILDLGIDTSTASGKLVANVMASVAQWEREVIGERTSAALQILKSNGHRLGRPVETSDDARSRIVAERSEGRTMQAIADGLTADGVPTARGGKWYPSTIRRVLGSVALDTEARRAA